MWSLEWRGTNSVTHVTKLQQYNFNHQTVFRLVECEQVPLIYTLYTLRIFQRGYLYQQCNALSINIQAILADDSAGIAWKNDSRLNFGEIDDCELSCSKPFSKSSHHMKATSITAKIHVNHLNPEQS